MIVLGHRFGTSAASRPLPVVAGAALYWRLNITDSNDYPSAANGGAANAQGKWCTIAEVNFRTVAGTNVNMVGLGTPSASSTYSLAGYEANKAIDASSGTAWVCGEGNGQNCRWQFQYGSAVQIVQVALTSFNTALGAIQMLKTATLQKSSDGTNWNTVLTISNQTAWGTSETRLFNVP